MASQDRVGKPVTRGVCRSALGDLGCLLCHDDPFHTEPVPEEAANDLAPPRLLGPEGGRILHRCRTVIIRYFGVRPPR